MLVPLGVGVGQAVAGGLDDAGRAVDAGAATLKPLRTATQVRRTWSPLPALKQPLEL